MQTREAVEAKAKATGKDLDSIFKRTIAALRARIKAVSTEKLMEKYKKRGTK